MNPDRSPTAPRSRGSNLLRRASAPMLLVGLALAVSGEATPSAQDRTVRVEPARLELAVGASARLRAEVVDTAGVTLPDAPVVFFSLDREAVSVTPEGVVTAHRPGEYRVAALSPETVVPDEPADRTGRYDAGARTEIVVRVPAPPVVRLAVDGVPAAVYAGTAFRLGVEAVDAAGGRERVVAEIESDTPAVLAPAAGGRIEALAPGSATLRLRHAGHTEQVAIQVEPNPIAAISLEISASRVRTGDVLTAGAGARDAAGATVTKVPIAFALESWPDPARPESVGAGAPAMLSPDGRFVAEQPGVYWIVATSGAVVARAPVTVVPRDVGMDVEMVGHAPIRDRVTSDLWVWEGLDGRDYAVVGTWNAEGHAYFYDVTDPARMELVDTVQVDARTVNDVKVSEDGRIAVISREGASDRRNGLVILDVSNPRDVRILSRFDDQLTGGVHNVFIHDEHVYAVNNGRRFDIVNIEDPERPVRVGRFETDSPGRSVHDVWVHDGIAYQAGRTDGLVVVDVGGGGRGGSPTRPVEIARIPQLTGWNHSAWPFHSPSTGKTYVLGGDEAFQSHPLAPEGGGILWREKLPSRARGWIHFVDITDPEHPREVARYQVPESGPHNYWIDRERELLYVGHFDAGLRVVDISGDLQGDLYRQGREVARFYTDDPQGFIPNAPFVWGPQPHKGTIFLADFSSGLWAVRLQPRRRADTATPAFAAEESIRADGADARLVVEPRDVRLVEGESLDLRARLADGDEPANLVWFSLDPQAVSVSPEGRVTAHAAGEHRLVALVPAAEAPASDVLQAGDPGIRREVAVTVTRSGLSRLELVDLPTEMLAGAVAPVRARVVAASGEARDVRPDLEVEGSAGTLVPFGPIFGGSDNAHPFYRRERPALYAAEAAGLVEAHAVGEIVVRAEHEGLTAETVVRVVAPDAAGLRVEADRSRVRTGDVVRLRAVGPASAPTAVRWALESSPDSWRAESRAAGAPAQVLADGRFVAEQPGVYTVVATVGGTAARTTLEVEAREVRQGVEFLGHGPVRDRVTSDLWVWTASDGRDYAITGTWQADGHAYFWDVTDPRSIRRVAEVQVDARTVNDVKVSEDGRLCVISREGASNRRNGLVILDCTDPSEPRILSRFDDEMTGGVHNVFVHDGHVYAINNGRRWDVVNIEDPANPVRVGRFESDLPGRSVHDVWVRDGIAYQAGNTEGIVVVDVGGGNAGGSPANPVEIGRLAQLTGWNHAVWPFYSRSADRFYVLAGDESHPVNPRDPDNIINIDARMASRAMGWIHVLDFSDPDAPREVARYRVPEAGPHNLWIDWEAEVMYVAYFNGGLRVVDLSGDLVGDLYRQGREIARFYSDDPQGYVPNAPFVWGPQLHRGTLFFSDFHSGLWAIRLTGSPPDD